MRPLEWRKTRDITNLKELRNFYFTLEQCENSRLNLHEFFEKNCGWLSRFDFRSDQVRNCQEIERSNLPDANQPNCFVTLI